jgi:hypothetical protein
MEEIVVWDEDGKRRVVCDARMGNFGGAWLIDNSIAVQGKHLLKTPPFRPDRKVSLAVTRAPAISETVT